MFKVHMYIKYVISSDALQKRRPGARKKRGAFFKIYFVIIMKKDNLVQNKVKTLFCAQNELIFKKGRQFQSMSKISFLVPKT